MSESLNQISALNKNFNFRKIRLTLWFNLTTITSKSIFHPGILRTNSLTWKRDWKLIGIIWPVTGSF